MRKDILSFCIPNNLVPKYLIFSVHAIRISQ
jgi:hypothetical protein